MALAILNHTKIINIVVWKFTSRACYLVFILLCVYLIYYGVFNPDLFLFKENG